MYSMTDEVCVPESQHQMQCRFFLYVVVSQCPAIFKLLASKNESLLIRRYTFFVLPRSTWFAYDYKWTLCRVSSMTRLQRYALQISDGEHNAVPEFWT